LPIARFRGRTFAQLPPSLVQAFDHVAVFGPGVVERPIVGGRWFVAGSVSGLIRTRFTLVRILAVRIAFAGGFPTFPTAGAAVLGIS
jgi:hypothetical protein